MSDVTQILQQIESGDPSAGARLLSAVYDELRALAAAKMAQESPDHTLQATALVHEAWLRLAGPEEVSWENRRHFFAAASEAMRRVLIDATRRRGRLKRGGDGQRVDIDLSRLPGLGPDTDLLELNEALDSLAARDPSSCGSSPEQSSGSQSRLNLITGRTAASNRIPRSSTTLCRPDAAVR